VNYNVISITIYTSIEVYRKWKALMVIVHQISDD